MLSQELGAKAELVVKKHFERKGYVHKESHKKLFGVEVDLIFQGKNFRGQTEYYFVEVKRYSSFFEVEKRWPSKQKKRFMHMASCFAEANSSPVRCLLAMVSKENEVIFYENDLESELKFMCEEALLK